MLVGGYQMKSPRAQCTLPYPPYSKSLAPIQSGKDEIGKEVNSNLLLQLRQSLHRLLNRRPHIHPMAIIQVNTLHTQPLQTLLTRLPTVLRAGVHHRSLPLPNMPIREFCSQENVFSLFGIGGKPFPDQVFRVLVDVRAVPEGLAELVGPVQNGET